jgi:uncharacterized protein (TIGR03083 family)
MLDHDHLDHDHLDLECRQRPCHHQCRRRGRWGACPTQAMGRSRMGVNTMDYAAKDTMLDVIRTERARFYDIVDDPKNWEVQTRCSEWEVRDVVGHMIDVTEGYLNRWQMAKSGRPANAVGLLVMAQRLDENAKTMRRLTREDAIARLKGDSDKMMTIFGELTPDEWGSFNVTHPYMGPLPTLFYPAFHVMDYGVHTWDMEWGLGKRDAALDERTAGVLVPYMFILMLSTLDEASAKGVDIEVGIKVDGEWGGQWLVTVRDGTFSYAPAEHLEGAKALIHFKTASDFVLTTFQRVEGGEATGDPTVIETFRHLFFRI